eukprot:TRINITY_DN85845_c0_g1_i1.p1 TRINITY_DN85845_c0_g1~~TRINITY_DN85845_c0_g1_i1.p1  ORF type:complete len:236 (-),score=30.60 TRINITY_DN85845_c0_g1_i1:334-936(-)
MSVYSSKTFYLDEFAIRQWDDPDYQGTKIQYDKQKFVEEVQKRYDEEQKLVEGYADFCKHVFIPNFVGATVGSMEITPENQHYLKTGYVKRRPDELEVLSRWFPADQATPTVAKYLDIILYSREQIILENKARGEEVDPPNAPWGIISVKAQDEGYETPMQPITMMRNALGKEEGGSGVPLDKNKYEQSVQYWENRAPIV